MEAILLKDLEVALRRDDRLISDDDRILKNKAVELANKLDEDLVRILFDSAPLKKVFFKKVGELTLFNKDLFIEFVSNKEFLPDSYTAFKNKIGLAVDRNYLKQDKEVTLVWPYKDCVLEGGQTKEDAKRGEIFWNTTLAPDEINRLLEPKVFTNWKRYDKNNSKRDVRQQS
jgi:adenine-specific DNA-methyltransferase